MTLRANLAFGELIRPLFMDVAHIFTLKTTFKNCATKILIKALYLLGYVGHIINVLDIAAIKPISQILVKLGWSCEQNEESK